MDPAAYLLAFGWHRRREHFTHHRHGSHTLERALAIQLAERRDLLAFEAAQVATGPMSLEPGATLVFTVDPTPPPPQRQPTCPVEVDSLAALDREEDALLARLAQLAALRRRYRSDSPVAPAQPSGPAEASPPAVVPLVMGMAGEGQDNDGELVDSTAAPVVVNRPARPVPSAPQVPRVSQRERRLAKLNLTPWPVIERPLRARVSLPLAPPEPPPPLTEAQRARQKLIAPMLLGPGDRREDCTLYGEHVMKVAKLAIDGHCPRSCPDFQAVDRKAMLNQVGGDRPGRR